MTTVENKRKTHVVWVNWINGEGEKKKSKNFYQRQKDKTLKMIRIFKYCTTCL